MCRFVFSFLVGGCLEVVSLSVSIPLTHERHLTHDLTHTTSFTFTTSSNDHNTFAKMTNFETGLKVPFMIRSPGHPQSAGQQTSVLAELVDMYRTTAELTGAPTPESSVNGTSLAPVLVDPTNTGIKDAAYSQFAKAHPKTAPYQFWPTPLWNETHVMGYSVRTADWHYVAWFQFNNGTVVPELTAPLYGQELYDHRQDSGLWLENPYENVNVVTDPVNKAIVVELHQKVVDHIRLYPIKPDTTTTTTTLIALS